MSENIKSNQIISDKLIIDELSSTNNKKDDLMLRLKEVHCKSEERTFDLNEKFNQIKEELQTLMEEYKSNKENVESNNDELDLTSIQEYINDFITQERNSSINIINDSFEKISNNLDEIVDNNNSNLNSIENALNELKNDFEQNLNNTVNHTLEIESQKDDINDKLINQMQEQFDKINKLIDNEKQNLSKTQIEQIQRIKQLLNNLLKFIKREKIQ